MPIICRIKGYLFLDNMKVVILIPYIEFYSKMYPDYSIYEVEAVLIDHDLVTFLESKGHTVIKFHVDENAPIHTWLPSLIDIKPDLVWCDFYTADNYLDVYLMCDVFGLRRTCDSIASLYFLNNKYLLRCWLQRTFPHLNPPEWTYGDKDRLVKFMKPGITYILKPTDSSGSSGMLKVTQPSDIPDTSHNVILESFIRGGEFGFVYYDTDFIGVYCINLPHDSIFTTDLKEHRTEYYMTSGLPDMTIHKKELQQVVNTLKLKGLSRFDTRIGIDNKLIILEINNPATCDICSLTPNIYTLYELMLTKYSSTV